MADAKKHRAVRRFCMVVFCAVGVAAATVATTHGAAADPDSPAPPLPVLTATPTDWVPNLGGRHADRITEVDIAALREMCQWFNAQFGILMDQVTAFNANLAAHGDNYTAPGVQQQADAVTANINQSTAYLTPRADSLGESRTCTYANTLYVCNYGTNIEGGESFQRIAEQQRHISDGFTTHNPAFINNIAIGLTNAAADKIRSQGVCM
jgi:hypothetical protein